MSFDTGWSTSVPLTFSNNDNTVTWSGGSSWPVSARATLGKNSGKWYFEVQLNFSSPANALAGLIDSFGYPSDTLAYYGAGVDGEGYLNFFAYPSLHHDYYGPALATGDVVGVAMDLDNGVVWFSINGDWLYYSDPGTGTNWQYTLSGNGPYYPAVSLDLAGQSATLRTQPSDFSYPIPTGFDAYDPATSVSVTVPELALDLNFQPPIYTLTRSIEIPQALTLTFNFLEPATYPINILIPSRFGHTASWTHKFNYIHEASWTGIAILTEVLSVHATSWNSTNTNIALSVHATSWNSTNTNIVISVHSTSWNSTNTNTALSVHATSWNSTNTNIALSVHSTSWESNQQALSVHATSWNSTNTNIALSVHATSWNSTNTNIALSVHATSWNSTNTNIALSVHATSWESNQQALSVHTTSWNSTNTNIVLSVHSTSWESTQQALSVHTSNYKSVLTIISVHSTSWNSADPNMAMSVHSSRYRSFSLAPQTISAMAYIEPDIKIRSASVTADEGSAYYQCQVNLANSLDYFNFVRDQPFILHLFDDEYHFVVDLKDLTRSANDSGVITTDVTLTGLSPLCLKDSPRATPITKTWSTSKLASQIVEELLGTVTWNLVDWMIPAYRLSAEGSSPLAIAQQIVQAAGGLIESQPDGSIVIRHMWPTSIADLNTVIPDYVLYEHNIFSAQESPVQDTLMNRVRILDEEVSHKDVFEYVADKLADDSDDPRHGVLYAYLSPWRTTCRIATTRGSKIQLGPLSEGTKTVDPITIEFKDGKSSVNYPIATVTQLTWLDENLGGVTYGTQGNELTASLTGGYYGCSLANIQYTTKYIKVPVTCTEPLTGSVEAQFLLLEQDNG